MIDISNTALRSREFAAMLLSSFGLAVVHGSAFGSTGEGTVRVSFCTDSETIAKGISRLDEALHSA